MRRFQGRGGRGGMPNMNQMMKQMEKMQKELEKSQKDLEETEFKSSAGGGMIEVVANGKNEILSVEIKEEVTEDLEMLEDLVMVCVNDVLQQIEKESESQIGDLTGGMNIPGL